MEAEIPVLGAVFLWLIIGGFLSTIADDFARRRRLKKAGKL